MTPPPPLPNPPKSHLLTYRISRGEQGVLTFEPYKTHLLPLWRFRSIPIAHTSSAALWQEFERFHEAGDFVGMDMCRKFIQMGMTRAKRYANYKGGRKFVGGKGVGVVVERSRGHEGMGEKEECSRIFRGVWERCKEHEGYRVLKKEFLREQGVWDKKEKERLKREGTEEGRQNPIAANTGASRRTRTKRMSAKESKRSNSDCVEGEID